MEDDSVRTMKELEHNFDCMFTAAETPAGQSDLSDLQRHAVTSCMRHIPTVGGTQHSKGMTPTSHGNSRGSSRPGSGPGSRGSPARKPTMSTLCPSNPTLTELQGGSASRSHSMRDQTSHMKEKYQSRYSQRRMSTKNSSPASGCGSKNGSRNNSLHGEQVEVTRQFLATNKKVINRGDSFKKKEKPAPPFRSKVERNTEGSGDDKLENDLEKVYRVVFLGSSEVGKTSIIDQFMSSEHADVYVENIVEDDCEHRDTRTVTVDVNGEESRISFIEAPENDLSSPEELNPDCFVLVYAVDDEGSFAYAKKSLSTLSSSNSMAGKSCILVGNKADLARSRLVQTVEGCDLAVTHGVKFAETSPGMGHHIDELLVGIVMQMRLKETSLHCIKTQSSLKEAVKGFFQMFGTKEDEKRKSCRNLNV